MPSDPVDVVRRLGGRARTGDVLSLSPRTALIRALDERRLVRPARGVIVLPELPDPEVAAARAGGVLSHLTAAQRLGLTMVTVPDVVHVTVPHGARRRLQQGVQLHSSVVPLEAGTGVTSLVRTVLDCATLLPFDEALAIADSALSRTAITRAHLVAAAAASSRTNRRRRSRPTASPTTAPGRRSAATASGTTSSSRMGGPS